MRFRDRFNEFAAAVEKNFAAEDFLKRGTQEIVNEQIIFSFNSDVIEPDGGFGADGRVYERQRHSDG
jgi:hypothetical protein